MFTFLELRSRVRDISENISFPSKTLGTVATHIQYNVLTRRGEQKRAPHFLVKAFKGYEYFCKAELLHRNSEM